MPEMTVDLDVIRRNAKKIASRTPLCAVVKANAYGHGAVAVTRALRGIARSFAVATADEAEELTDFGVREEILILGNARRTVRADNVVYTVSSFEDVDRLSREGAFSFAVAVDTGMHRFGAAPSDARLLVAYASRHGNVRSVYTHLRDHTDAQLSEKQYGLFAEATGDDVLRHISASGGLLLDKKFRMDEVRIGIALYGGMPGQLQAMTVTAPVLAVRNIPAGEGVGYGSRVFMHDTTVAVVGIGYADGYRRLTAPRTLLICGRECKVLSVCMDVCFAELPKGVRRADRAVITGRALPLTRLAESYGTITYEAMTCFGSRVKRIYTGEA